MSLKQQIDNDIKKAMLAKNKEELEALRAIKSLILLAETDKSAGGEFPQKQKINYCKKRSSKEKNQPIFFSSKAARIWRTKKIFSLKS